MPTADAALNPSPTLRRARPSSPLRRRTLATLALLWTLALAWTSAPAQTRTMVSVSKQAYLRDGAGTHHTAQWLLDPGYPLVVIGRQGNWLQVQDFEDDTGWIYRPLTGSVRHHVVTSRIANIRRGPSTQAGVLGKARYGEVLKTLDKRPQWVKVKQPGGPTGWVARRLLWGW